MTKEIIWRNYHIIFCFDFIINRILINPNHIWFNTIIYIIQICFFIRGKSLDIPTQNTKRIITNTITAALIVIAYIYGRHITVCIKSGHWIPPGSTSEDERTSVVVTDWFCCIEWLIEALGRDLELGDGLITTVGAIDSVYVDKWRDESAEFEFKFVSDMVFDVLSGCLRYCRRVGCENDLYWPHILHCESMDSFSNEQPLHLQEGSKPDPMGGISVSIGSRCSDKLTEPRASISLSASVVESNGVLLLFIDTSNARDSLSMRVICVLFSSLLHHPVLFIFISREHMRYTKNEV
eukprot:673817_1